MSRDRARHLALLAAVLLALPAGAAATKYTADFQTDGTGARPLAMGGAFTALADDANALFFNPGALAFLPDKGLTLMHSERFGGLVKVDHAAFHSAVQMRGREASLGLSVLRVAVDGIRFTGAPEDYGYDPDADPDGVYGPDDLDSLLAHGFDPSAVIIQGESDQEWCVLGACAVRLGGWSVGGDVKVIYQTVGEFNSFGFGLDAGALSPVLKGGLRAGLKVADLTGTYVAWNTGVSEYLPPSLRPGLSWQHRFPGLNATLLLAADAELRFQNYEESAVWHFGRTSIDPHAGGELWILDAVALRAGVDREAWTAGGGLRLSGSGGVLPWTFLRDLSLDYGFGSHEDFDGSHRLGLGMRF